MTQGLTTVFVPCDVVPLRVRVGYGEHLSPLEQVILSLLVHQPRVTVGELAGLLALRERLVLDLIYDLWQQELLSMDFASGELTATPEVDNLVKRGGLLNELGPAESSDEVWSVLVEKLTGAVLPYRGTSRPSNWKLVVPVDAEEFSVTNLPRSELLEAVQRLADERWRDALGEGLGAGRMPRVLAAGPVPKEVVPEQGRRRWLSLEVQVSVDLQVEVIDSRVSGARRRLMSQALTRLVADEPASQLARSLAAAAATEYLEPPTFEQALEGLLDLIREAPQVLAGGRVAHHEALLVAAGEVRDQMLGDTAREVEAEVLTHPQEHLAAIKELVTSARTQVLLAFPDLTHAGLRDLHPSLEEALQRGVQVVLIWGARRGQVLDDGVTGALYDLARSGRLFWTPRLPARSNAHVVVCDDCEALVAAAALTRPADDDDMIRLGVRIRAVGQAPCPPIESLLSHLQRTMPDGAVRRSILTWRGDFRSEVETATVSETAELLPALPEPPNERAGEAGTFQAQAWTLAWSAYAQSLVQMSQDRQRPLARVTVDGDHVAALSRARQSPGQRLLVASKQPEAGVVHGALLTDLERLLGQGVEIGLITDHEVSAEVQQTLRGLESAAGNGRFWLRQVRSDARALVWSENVIVGSFDFLSRANYTDGRRRLRSEIGVELTGAGIARVVARALGAQVAEPGAVVRPPRPRLSRLAEQLVRMPGQLDKRVVAERVAVTESPLDTVEQLAELGADSRLLRVAVGGALRTADLETPEAQRWLRWLVTDFVRGQEILEAATLREAVKDVEFAPRLALARLARGRRTSHSADLGGKALVEALETDGRAPAEAVTVAVIVAVDLLLGTYGGAEDVTWLAHHQETLELLGGLAAPWSRLRELALEYGKLASRPLPLARIELELTEGQREEAVREAWSGLEGAFEAARASHFPIAQATKAHALLLQRGRLLGRLQAAVAAREIQAVEAWLEDLPELGQVLDEATREAAPGTTTIHSRIRRSYLTRLEAVVEAARRLVRSTRRSADDWPRRGREQALSLARALHELTPELDQTSEGMPEPERDIVRRVLSDLDPIARWGGR